MTHNKTNCVICQRLITEQNDSKEHILPQAIGGRLTVHNFICKTCNNTTGHSWDAECAQQLNSLSNFFAIKRERGKPRPHKVVTSENEKLNLNADGRLSLQNPVVSQTSVEGGTEIYISARSIKETKPILAGLKKKYPSLNLEKIYTTVENRYTYPQGDIHLSFTIGGELSGRSIVKSAVAFAHKQGIPEHLCEVATFYLRNISSPPCYGFYHATDLINNRPNGSPIHVVAVSGNSENGLLIGYIEYFGIHRMVACLSEKYTGKDISATYAIDPTTGQKLDLSVGLNFSRQEIQDIFEYKKAFGEGMSAAVGSVTSPVLQRNFENERERVTSDAINYAWKNCGAKEGELLTSDHLETIARLASEKMMPFMAHITKPRKRPV